MKSKIYFIIYSIIQILMGAYYFVYSKDIVTEQVKELQKTFSTLPEEYSKVFLDALNVNTLSATTKLLAIVGIVIAIVFLILVLKNQIREKKGLAVVLLVISMFLIDSITMILALIALIVMIKIKPEEKKEKEKKEIKKLIKLPVTKTEHILGLTLVLVYFSQYFIFDLIQSNLLVFISGIVFYIVVFILTILAFSKQYIRDLKEIKSNFKTYFVYALKWWGIMLLISLGIGIIKVILNIPTESANQETLNSLPIIYVGLLSILWAPIVEEGIFRGFVRRGIKNDKLFILISAIAFGLLHTIGIEETLYDTIIQSVQYAAMGGVFAYVYTKTNNLCVNTMMHMFQNIMATIIMALSLLG